STTRCTRTMSGGSSRSPGCTTCTRPTDRSIRSKTSSGMSSSPCSR
ncbi:hypothetical protein AB1N83_006922, partial [Pleurotus pulmonarius]